MQQNLQAALYGEGREIHQCALPGNVGHLSIPFKRTPYTDLKHIEQQGRVRFWPLLLPLGLPGAYAVGERQWRDEGHENHHDFTSSFHSVMVWCDGMILKVGFWGHLQSKGFRAKSIEFAKIQIGQTWQSDGAEWISSFDIMIHVIILIWSYHIRYNILSYHIIWPVIWLARTGSSKVHLFAIYRTLHWCAIPSNVWKAACLFHEPRQLWRFL